MVSATTIPDSASALRWASKGWPVFPLVPNGKNPATAHGFKDANTAPWFVSSSWDTRPGANIGLATGGGLVVLDIDRKGGKDGFAALERVGLSESKLDDLNTYSVDTPSGGRHYYFCTSEDVKSRSDVLGRGSGVDLRGVGGYVVAPPSIVDGKPYTVRPGFGNFWDGVDVPERGLLADWSTVAPYLRKPEPSATPPPSNLPPSPSGGPSVLDRAAAYLGTVDPAISGQGGHDATFRPAVALVHGFQLSAEDAFALLRDVYNPRCRPPWSEKELRHKVEDAVKAGPPSGKAPGWLLDGVEVRPADGAAPSSPLPVVEVEETDEDTDEDEPDEGTVENIEDVPLPPGYVGELARWILARCCKPWPPFAILASLVVWSVLASRKVRVQNQTPVLYVGAVTFSNNGKEDVQKLAASILDQVGLSSRHFGGRLASWNAAIEEFMGCWAHPVLFASVDEAAGYLGQVVKGDYGMKDFLKEVWSAGLRKVYPWGRVRQKGKGTLTAIYHPAYNLFLGTQPSTLGAAVGRAQLEDGLLPRVLWVVRPRFEVKVQTANYGHSFLLRESEDGLRILDRARRLWNWFHGQADNDFRDMADLESRPAPDAKPKGKEDEDEGGGLPPAHAVWDEPLSFELEPKAADFIREYVCRTQTRVKGAAEGTAGPVGYLWGKAAENALRVSLILAAARLAMTPAPYIIKAEEAAWAVRFVEAAGWSAIKWAGVNVADTLFERDLKRVLEFIRCGGSAVKKSEITRRFRLPGRLLDDILSSLCVSGEVEAVVVSTKGRAADGYRAVSKRGRRK